jgi:hypothetical protein
MEASAATKQQQQQQQQQQGSLSAAGTRKVSPFSGILSLCSTIWPAAWKQQQRIDVAQG